MPNSYLIDYHIHQVILVPMKLSVLSMNFEQNYKIHVFPSSHLLCYLNIFFCKRLKKYMVTNET